MDVGRYITGKIDDYAKREGWFFGHFADRYGRAAGQTSRRCPVPSGAGRKKLSCGVDNL
jgi:hypothetical protein